MERIVVYTCEKHLDKAFDCFINDNETFPVMEKVQDQKCVYCDEEASYSLTIGQKQENC